MLQTQNGEFYTPPPGSEVSQLVSSSFSIDFQTGVMTYRTLDRNTPQISIIGENEVDNTRKQTLKVSPTITKGFAVLLEEFAEKDKETELIVRAFKRPLYGEILEKALRMDQEFQEGLEHSVLSRTIAAAKPNK